MAGKKTFGKSLMDNFLLPPEDQEPLQFENPLKEEQNAPVTPVKKSTVSKKNNSNLKELSIQHLTEIKRPQINTSLSVVAFKIKKNNQRTEKAQILQKREQRKEQRKTPENIEDLPVRGGTYPHDKINFGIVLNKVLYDRVLASKGEKRLNDNKKWGLATIVREILENSENWPPWLDKKAQAPLLPIKIQDGKNLSVYISKDIYLKLIKASDTCETSISRICNEIINAYFNE